MTVFEMEAKKAELARRILLLNDENTVNEISNYLTGLFKHYPCDYTVEEVARTCEDAIKQHEEGKTIPLDQVKRKIS